LLRLFTWPSVLALLLAYLSTYVSPKDVSWLALFGLVYPLWLFLSFSAFILCLVFRRRLFLVPLVAILLGVGHLSDFIQWNGSNEATENDMKIMSYNVRIFDAYDWSEGANTRDSILAVIRDQQPDILCIQEFYHTTKRQGFDLREDISEILQTGPPTLGYTHNFSDQHFYGLATFSRYPVISSGVVDFHDHKDNLCSYVDIQIDEDTLRVYNAHLASIRFQEEDYEFVEQKSEQPVTTNFLRITNLLLKAFEKRADQAEKIHAHISESPYPILLCGDFNDTPVSYSYSVLSKDLNDIFHSHGNGMERTYVGRFPSFRIDYIMHSDEIMPSSFETVEKEFSDHRPIVATFNLSSEED
jgi:endonuclease/exonuclease/phosphatase family metal-dependent hydrolase